MRVKWVRRAERNLDEIGDYIASDNEEAAANVVARIAEAIDLLKTHPSAGRAGRVVGTRELIITGTPDIVAYRVRDDVIQVLRVLHGARKWPASF